MEVRIRLTYPAYDLMPLIADRSHTHATIRNSREQIISQVELHEKYSEYSYIRILSSWMLEWLKSELRAPSDCQRHDATPTNADAIDLIENTVETARSPYASSIPAPSRLSTVPLSFTHPFQLKVHPKPRIFPNSLSVNVEYNRDRTKRQCDKR